MIRIAVALTGMVLLASCATAPQVTPAARSELAPTGKLRVGINYGNVVLAGKDAASGEFRGVAVDLARELGRRLGVPVELVGYASGGRTAGGAKTGDWDVAFLAIEPARAAEITFTAPYVVIESTYLVPPGSPLRTISDVDREGVRIIVSAKGGNDLFLTRNLKRARLVRAPTPDAAFKQFVSDRLDAYAGLKPALVRNAQQLPGSRVIEGNYTMVQQAVGTPVGRAAAASYLREFVEDIKASGLVARTIENNDARGLTVAPLAQGAGRIEIGGGMSY